MLSSAKVESYCLTVVETLEEDEAPDEDEEAEAEEGGEGEAREDPDGDTQPAVDTGSDAVTHTLCQDALAALPLQHTGITQARTATLSFTTDARHGVGNETDSVRHLICTQGGGGGGGGGGEGAVLSQAALLGALQEGFMALHDRLDKVEEQLRRSGSDA